MEWGIREYVEAYFDPEKVELPRLDDPKRLRRNWCIMRHINEVR